MLFKSYLAIHIWDSFQSLQHGRKKDYKILLIYFLVIKISKCKLKIQTRQQDVVAQKFTFTARFEKGKKLKIFLRRFSSLCFPNFSISDLISGFCHCDRFWELLNSIVPKTLLTKVHARFVSYVFSYACHYSSSSK